MDLTNKQNNLFDRYVFQIGKYLPKENKKDIQLEIISSLKDALDDRTASVGKDPDEDMIINVIKEFGPPEKVAASYSPNNFLIGPRFYNTFTELVKVIIYICAALLLVNIVAKIADPNEVFISTSRLSYFMDQLSGWALKTLGVIVIVFAAMEFRTRNLMENSDKLIPEKTHPIFDIFRTNHNQESVNWDPKKLPLTGKYNQTNNFKLIMSSVWLFFLIVLFNLFPQWVGLFVQIDNGFMAIPFIIVFFTGYIIWIGIYRGMKLILYIWLLFAFTLLTSTYLKGSAIFNSVAEGQIDFIPLLSEGFTTIIPLISVYWFFKLIFTLWKLKIKQNNNSTRWVNISLKIVGLLIMIFIFTGPSIIGLNPEYLALGNITGSTLEMFSNSVKSISAMTNLFLVSALYINAFQIVILVYREFRVSKSSNEQIALHFTK